MKKRPMFYLNFLLAFYISFIIYSCSKNPVEPPPPDPVPDTSSRYDWNIIDFPRELNLSWLYAADTNNIWITASQNKTFYYNGINFSEVIIPNNVSNPLSFQNVRIGGFDKNNLFFAGLKNYGSNLNAPFLLKYTNGVFDSLLLSSSIDVQGFYDVIPTGTNSAWLTSGYNGKVYYYTNNSIVEYSLRDSLAFNTLYINSMNNVFVFGFKYSSTENKIYNYKFNGVSFDLLGIENLIFGGLSDLIFRCGKDILISSIGYDVFYFNGTNWQHHSTLENASILNLGGYSKDSLIAITLPESQIYTYNGIKWRKEGIRITNEYVSNSANYVQMEYSKGYLFGTYSDPKWGISNLIIGKAKN
jgi:hypothetical protein